MKTSAPTTTNAKPAPAARSRTTSASSPPSASKSPSPASPNRTPPDQTTRQPDPHHPFTRLRCAPPGAAACPAGLSFSGQRVVVLLRAIQQDHVLHRRLLSPGTVAAPLAETSEPAADTGHPLAGLSRGPLRPGA